MDEMKKPWFLALNPKGTMPTLQDGEFGIGESVAIQNYILEKKKHNSSFLPKDIKKYHKIKQVVCFEMGGLRQICQKLYSTEIFAPRFKRVPGASAEDL